MVVAARSFESWVLVYRDIACVPSWGQTVVHTHYALDAAIARGRYYTPADANFELQSILDGFREEILKFGGSPEAVTLLDPFLRFTKKEKDVMASKLEKKAEAKAAPAKKAAAAKVEKAPAAKKEAAKPKGNPDALKKAQEAAATKRSEMDARKIKPLIKPKENPAREGTFRHSMLNDLLGCKTVGEFKAMNEKYDAGCIKFAVDNEYISLS